MITYRTVGNATEWSPCGVPQTVKRLETVGTASGSTWAVPVSLSMKSELNKKGVRRVVVQAQGTIPGTLVNDLAAGAIVDPKGQTPVSVHIVFQAPQLALAGEIDADSSIQTLRSLLLSKLMADVFAVCTNKSIDADAESFGARGLIHRALLGSEGLDLVSGAYGDDADPGLGE